LTPTFCTGNITTAVLAVTTYLETDTSELTRRTKYKNYQIKSVRKGLPDMLLEDSKRKSSNHAMPSKGEGFVY